MDINKIIADNFEMAPNFLSLDVEGLDFEIIKSLDFTKYKPEVLCLETLEVAENRVEIKNLKMINYIKSKGYMVYADTYINSIFVDEHKWRNRHPANQPVAT